MVSQNIRATKFRDSTQRDEIIKIFHGRCLLNPSHAGCVVHEIEPKSQRPRTWQETSNMVLLCSECHNKIHQEGAHNWVTKLKILREKWMINFYG